MSDNPYCQHGTLPDSCWICRCKELEAKLAALESLALEQRATLNRDNLAPDVHQMIRKLHEVILTTTGENVDRQRTGRDPAQPEPPIDVHRDVAGSDTEITGKGERQ